MEPTIPPFSATLILFLGMLYLRLELLPKEQTLGLQELFRRYVDSRLEAYRRMPDNDAAGAAMANAEKLEKLIWTTAVTATELPGAHPDAGKLLLPALNNMIDITTVRAMSLQLHPQRSYTCSCLPWDSCVPYSPATAWQPPSTEVGSTSSAFP